MKQIVKALLIVLSFAGAESCRQAQNTGNLPVQYARTLLADHSMREWQSVSREADKSGSIAIVGSPDRCVALQRAFVECDAADNVTGALLPDALPDFCGETIESILDYANTPYHGYSDSSNTDFLREIAVRNAVAAMDTVCYISPYDREGMGRKKRAKVLIMASPYFAQYGKWDIDTLLTEAGNGMKVIYPIVEAFSSVIKKREAPVMIGVLAQEGDIAPEVYSQILSVTAAQMGRSDCSCIAFQCEESEHMLQDFVDSCLVAGFDGKFDAIIADDWRLSSESLSATYERLTSVMSEESMVYSALFSKDFELVKPMEVSTAVCRDYLRKANLFTHNISYPKETSFMTVFVPDFDEELKYVRAEGSEASFMFIQYSDRYLPQENQQ